MKRNIVIIVFISILLVYLFGVVFIDEISRLITYALFSYVSNIDHASFILIVTVIVGNLVPAIMMIYLMYIGIYMRASGNLPAHLLIFFTVDDRVTKYMTNGGVLLVLFSAIYLSSIIYKIYSIISLVQID